VLVAQGEDDDVIPRDLLDRTWEYLTGESGAVATASRHPGGHGFVPGSVTALHDWLASVV
jgi:phospholipase/carboxylesterase